METVPFLGVGRQAETNSRGCSHDPVSRGRVSQRRGYNDTVTAAGRLPNMVLDGLRQLIDRCTQFVYSPVSTGFNRDIRSRFLRPANNSSSRSMVPSHISLAGR